MIRRRLGAVAAALIVLTTLMIGMAAGPAVVSASGPSWDVTVEPIPPNATAGDTAAFLVTIANGGKAIDKLLLGALTPDGATLVASTPSQGSCAEHESLGCLLGPLAAHGSASVLVVYQTPAEASKLKVQFAAAARFGDGDDRRANGDDDDDDDGDWRVIVRSGQVQLISPSDPDFAGRFVLDPSQRIVRNDQSIGGSNQHATRVVAPEIGIATWVDDIAGQIAGCGGSGGLPCFGAISEIHVNDGAMYGDGFKVVITFGAGELPLVADEDDHSGTRPFRAKDLHLQHELDDGSTENIPRCYGDDDDDDRHGSGSDLPCFMAWDRKDGSIRARITLTQNGLIQGW
jgi:hypothetical protein